MPDIVTEPPRLTFAELDNLGVSTDVPTAGRAFGLGRSQAYATARDGRFPCRVVQIGARLTVPTADLRAALGIAPKAAS